MTRPSSQRGYTLIEVLVASTIFAVIAVIALTAYVSIFGANRRADAERRLVDETAFLSERIVKEIRNAQIDYPEYRRWAVQGGAGTAPDVDETAADYARYLEQTPAGFAGLEAITGNEDLMDTATEFYPGLVLLSPDGDCRVRIRRGEDDARGVLYIRQERLVSDAGVWTWVTAPPVFSPVEVGPPPCVPYAEQELSSERMDVTDFSFQLTPLRDPFFAYEDIAVQQQPMVLLRLRARTHADFWRGPMDAPTIELSTTVSIRGYSVASWVPSPLTTP